MTTELAATGVELPSVRPPIWQRRWVQLTATAVVALSAGSAAGAIGVNDHAAQVKALKVQRVALTAQLDAANGKTSEAQSQATGLQNDLDAANAQVAKAKNAAAHALATAMKQVQAKNASAVAALNARAKALNAQAQSLDQRAAAVRAAENNYTANTIPAGVYVVGQDIDPGVYKTDGPDGSNASGCYYALLNSTDTSDIATNNISDGPATVTITGNYAAFDTSGCDDWHKVG